MNVQDTPEEIAEHNALVEEALKDIPEPAPGSVCEEVFEEWRWEPGTGFIKIPK